MMERKNRQNLINGKRAEFGNIEQIKILKKAERGISDKAEVKNFYKNLDPLAKAIDDIASIDWCMMVLKLKVEEVTEKLNGRSPISIMVDKATGHEKVIVKGFLIHLRKGYAELVKLFKRVGDMERLEQYKTLLENVKTELKTNYYPPTP